MQRKRISDREKQLFRKTRTRLAGGMSRRPASFTQADVARVLRAAKAVGASSVEVKVGDTTVVVSLDQNKPVDVRRPIRL